MIYAAFMLRLNNQQINLPFENNNNNNNSQTDIHVGSTFPFKAHEHPVVRKTPVILHVLFLYFSFILNVSCTIVSTSKLWSTS